MPQDDSIDFAMTDAPEAQSVVRGHWRFIGSAASYSIHGADVSWRGQSSYTRIRLVRKADDRVLVDVCASMAKVLHTAIFALSIDQTDANALWAFVMGCYRLRAIGCDSVGPL